MRERGNRDVVTETSTAPDRCPGPERTVADQARQIETLEEDLRFMVERQAELRNMLHAAHERLLDAQEQLDGGAPQRIASLEAELALTRQHAQDLDATLAQAGPARVAQLEEQLAWHQDAARQWEARAADLESRLARVRDSLPGRLWRLVSGGFR